MNLKKIIIDNIEFSSKAKVIEYTRNLLNNIGEKIIYECNDSFNFLNELIQRHPDADEKIGCGISAFQIKRNYCNKKAMETYIIRFDNTSINYSWISCCNGKPKSDKELLLRAMRCSVVDQILEFRKKSILKCVFCGCNNGDFHVDHVKPFKDLANIFLNNSEYIPTKFGKDLKYNQTIFLEDDNSFKMEWVNFHKSAEYQILCERCNLRKGCS
jgi:hypothetical protein